MKLLFKFNTWYKMNQYALRILYQSLEYPDRFTKEFAKELGQQKVKVEPCPHRPNTNPDEYDTLVSLLIHTYLKNLTERPDIIILGEYIPTNKNLKIDCYEFKGSVGEGVRGMSIFVHQDVLSDSETPLWRITLHDTNKSKKDIHINTNAMTIRSNKYKNYPAARKKQINLIQKNIKDNVGEVIEILARNRYFIMAHVKNEVKDINGNKIKSKKLAVQALQKMNYFHMAGDLNFAWKTKKEKAESKIVTNHMQNKNTKVLEIKGKDYKDLQTEIENVIGSGKTTYSTAHDGMYIREQDRTEVEILGGLWPIVFVKNKPMLIGDHKSIYFTITMSSHRDGNETDTGSETEDEDEEHDQDAKNKTKNLTGNITESTKRKLIIKNRAKN